MDVYILTFDEGRMIVDNAHSLSSSKSNEMTRERSGLSWWASLYILSLNIALLSKDILTGVPTNLKDRVVINTFWWEINNSLNQLKAKLNKPA